MTYHPPIAYLASYLILLRDGKGGKEVLLGRRINTGYHDGEYGLPAGHVENGESFTHGFLREVREEIGLNFEEKNARVVHLMHRTSDLDSSNRVDVFFSVENWTGEVENTEPDKCDDLSWFPLSHLPLNTIPYIREVLENIRKGVIYSETGW